MLEFEIFFFQIDSSRLPVHRPPKTLPWTHGEEGVTIEPMFETTNTNWLH